MSQVACLYFVPAAKVLPGVWRQISSGSIGLMSIGLMSIG
jgi:hypothetical protein